MLLALLALAASPVSADRIKSDVKILSSDAFLGRGPGEAGETKAIAYIARQFAAAGLQPGGTNGGWYQEVPLVRLDRAPGATLIMTIAAPPTITRSSSGGFLLNPGVTASITAASIRCLRSRIAASSAMSAGRIFVRSKTTGVSWPVTKSAS